MPDFKVGDRVQILGGGVYGTVTRWVLPTLLQNVQAIEFVVTFATKGWADNYKAGRTAMHCHDMMEHIDR